MLPNGNIRSLSSDGESLNGCTEECGVISSQSNFDTGPKSDADSNFSDAVLKYISHVLLEEDLEDITWMFQEPAALEAAEKSFYEVLNQHYPVSGYNPEVNRTDPSIENSGESANYSCLEAVANDGNHSCGSSNFILQSSSESASYGNSTVTDEPEHCSVNTLENILSLSDSAMQFNRGVEEARKFLPSFANLVVDLMHDKSIQRNKSDKQELSRKKKSPCKEKQVTKKCAIYNTSSLSQEVFAETLLCDAWKNKALRQVLKHGGRTHCRSSERKRNVVDLTTLLILCAQAVAADDDKMANEFLKEIRQHATPTGDGIQRLAYYFADGLEARMAGSGTKIYSSLMIIPASSTDILKAYHVYLASCPYRNISHFLANKTIMNLADKVTKLHIVDFGILYGFQWPCFLERLSTRPDFLKLRITGIDFPCSGFRPLERVEETGKHLTKCAEKFNVPFEFNAIAKAWETIKIEDLKLESDELLVVNCLFRLRKLMDESVTVNSPRDQVLNLIRKINPAVFILGVLNGAYNAPFFTTRFREALFHYSSIFDMLDANIPRVIHERMLLEKTFFGQQAMNVIACEGGERIERPETYKQWQMRTVRAGFEQLPLDAEIMKIANERVQSSYHKDFVVEQDGNWMLQGWKGRNVYALSTWRPENSNPNI